MIDTVTIERHERMHMLRKLSRATKKRRAQLDASKVVDRMAGPPNGQSQVQKRQARNRELELQIEQLERMIARSATWTPARIADWLVRFNDEICGKP